MSFPSHLREVSLSLLLLIAPLPLSVALLERASRDRGTPSLTYAVLFCLTVWGVMETCVAVGLGMLRHLRLQEVMLAESLILIGGIALCIRHPPLLRWRGLALSRWERLLLGLTACTGAALLYQVMSRLTDNYDSLMYHLPAMAKWYQSGAFTMLAQFDHLQSTYPYNWEALCTLFLLPFREDFWVTLPNVVAWVMWGASIDGVSRELGAQRLGSLTGAVLMLHAPIVLANVNTMHIDLPFAAFFMAGLYYALVYRRTRSTWDWGLFCLSLGMLVGMKMSGGMYAILLLGALAMVGVGQVGNWSSGGGWRRLMTRGAMLCLGVLLVGGFWYGRNLLERGNPFGVVKVHVGGVLLFPGSMDKAQLARTTLAHLFDVTHLPHWRILGDQLCVQLGLPLVAMGGLSLLWIFSILQRQRMGKRGEILGIVTLLVGTGLLYWTTPYSGDNGSYNWQITPWIGQGLRYAFPHLGLLSVTAALGVTAVPFWRVGAAFWALVSGAVALMDVVDSKKILVGVMLLLIGAAGGRVPSFVREGYATRWLRTWGAGVLLGSLLVGGVALSWKARGQREERRRHYLGGVMHYVTRSVRPDETIGYVGCNQSYALYGKRLDHRVEYVPALGPSRTDWFRSLRRRGVQVVAVGPLPQGTNLQELAWLNAPQSPFVRVFGRNVHEDTLLFRLRPL